MANRTWQEMIMLTRRGFAGCAICAVTGLIAAEATAQGAPPKGMPGVKLTPISQADGPAPGYVTIMVIAEVEPGITVGRHTHPGVECSHVLEGGLEMPIEGQPTKMLSAGDSYLIPAGTPHAGGKIGDKKTRILSTYVIEKGKPLASPV
jgi:quercetin dioxygenase-like cupin family protein